MISSALSSVVTPFVGVWIEIFTEVKLLSATAVTPFVGVWIEIEKGGIYIRGDSGHSLRGSVD